MPLCLPLSAWRQALDVAANEIKGVQCRHSPHSHFDRGELHNAQLARVAAKGKDLTPVLVRQARQIANILHANVLMHQSSLQHADVLGAELRQ